MNKTMWMLLLGATAIAAYVAPAVAEQEAEVARTPTEYCGICEAKKHALAVFPEWFTFGLDHRLRVTHRNNASSLGEGPFDKHATGHEFTFMRNRTRLWAKAQPIENWEVGARLIWEWFMFCKPKELDNTPSSDAIFDELYVKVAKVLDLPLTIIVGRQNMRILDGWLVFEGTPLDGSRTIFFDAIRGIIELPDMNSTVNAIYVANRADSAAYIKPFNGTATRDVDLDENDESGVILWLSNTPQENMQLDGYYIYVHREQPSSDNNTADIHTIGGRVAGNWSENIVYRAEAALQFGKKERDAGDSDANMCLAGGANARVTYLLQDERDTALHAGYEYRSGGRDPRQNFDILWGRYPQWSEILNGLADTLEGSPAAGGNFHRFNLGASMKPCEAAVLLLNWHILFADNNNLDRIGATGVSDDGCLRGNLLTGQLAWKHNHHATSTVTAELFMPGDFYTNARNDVATFLRYELMLVW